MNATVVENSRYIQVMCVFAATYICLRSSLDWTTQPPYLRIKCQGNERQNLPQRLYNIQAAEQQLSSRESCRNVELTRFVHSKPTVVCDYVQVPLPSKP